MAPPKLGAPRHMTRRSHKNNRSSLEPTIAVENPIETEGVVDVDAILSPYIPSPTLVEEQKENMKVDPPSTTIKPNQMRETTLPTTKVDTLRTEFEESRAQPSIEKT
jgi:hypothetical protein